MNLVRAGGHGVALDVSASALDLARRNAELNEIKNIDFIKADVFEGLKKLNEQ